MPPAIFHGVVAELRTPERMRKGKNAVHLTREPGVGALGNPPRCIGDAPDGAQNPDLVARPHAAVGAAIARETARRSGDGTAAIGRAELRSRYAQQRHQIMAMHMVTGADVEACRANRPAELDDLRPRQHGVDCDLMPLRHVAVDGQARIAHLHDVTGPYVLECRRNVVGRVNAVRACQKSDQSHGACPIYEQLGPDADRLADRLADTEAMPAMREHMRFDRNAFRLERVPEHQCVGNRHDIVVFGMDEKAWWAVRRNIEMRRVRGRQRVVVADQ